MQRFDAVIVGGGPAGSLAACRLARGGARVAILDGSHPREKPCGGGVTGRAMQIVRDVVDGRLIPAVTVHTAAFADGDGAARVNIGAVHAGMPPRLSVVSRRLFDGALLDAAVKSGASLIAARATDITREEGGWSVSTREGSVRGAWLIGADGVNSFVRRRVARPFARQDLSIATGFFVHGTTSSEIAIAFESSPAGYLWSFPRPDHLAVGACAQADQGAPAVLLTLASRWIERHVPRPFTLERYSWPIPSLRVAALHTERPSGPGWMLVGDAAGMVDPITREGIFFALVSAEAAARSLLGPKDPAAEYIGLVRDPVYAELLRAARLKARFFTPRFTGLLVHGLGSNPAIRSVMSDLVAGCQPYRGLRRRLLRTLDLRLMLDMMFKA